MITILANLYNRIFYTNLAYIVQGLVSIHLENAANKNQSLSKHAHYSIVLLFFFNFAQIYNYSICSSLINIIDTGILTLLSGTLQPRQHTLPPSAASWQAQESEGLPSHSPT